MYNHNKAQQSKNRVHISWDILYKIQINTKSVLLALCVGNQSLTGFLSQIVSDAEDVFMFWLRGAIGNFPTTARLG